MAGSTRSNNNKSSSSSSSEENMEKLMNRVCNNFISQMESKLDARLQKLEEKLTEVCDSIKSLRGSFESNSRKILELECIIDNVEQDRKRSSIRICGLPEDDREDLYTRVANFIQEDMRIDCSEADIDYCFRARMREEDKPRTVIVNFVTNRKKNEVLAGKKALKGTPFAAFEDLTSKRYQQLIQAKKKYGGYRAWSYNGRIYYLDPQSNKKMLLSGEINA